MFAKDRRGVLHASLLDIIEKDGWSRLPAVSFFGHDACGNAALFSPKAFSAIDSSPNGASGDLHYTMLWYFFRFNDHACIN